ncbi:MAG: YDG domain-containing protein, partial [Rubrivivax sp.]
VTIGGSVDGAFADKNVGVGKSVVLSGLTLGGPDGGNYTAVAPLGLTASITPLALSISFTAADKVYDGSTVATISGLVSGSAPLAGDSVSFVTGTASFGDKNVGVAKPVFASGFGLTGPDASNYTLAPVSPSSASITPLTLGLSGLGALDKVYDRTTSASLTGTATVLPLAGDSVGVGGTPVGTFASAQAGPSIPVDVSGLSLSGADAGNYTLASAAAIAAAITPAPLLLSGLTALDKVYDATLFAALAGTASVTPLAGDSVSVASPGSGVFLDKNVGVAKPVTLSGATLAGPDAGNYVVVGSATPLAADVTPATLSLSGVTVLDKVYDKTTTATLSGAGVAPLAGDVVVVGTPAASFASTDVGTGIPVTLGGSFTLGGADAGNYVLDPTLPALAGNITPFELMPTGIFARNRLADDSTLTVDVDTRKADLATPLPGDDVTLLIDGAYGLVGSATAGHDKPVTLFGLSLTGTDAHNYILLSGPGVGGIAVTLLTPFEGAFESLRYNEYLQGVSDAQEPFRRAMAEALAAGFGKENIRKRLSLGLVYETGLAPPAIDDIQPARGPATCNAGAAAGTPLACP